MSKYTYKLAESKEGEGEQSVVIEKHGYVHTFTAAEVQSDLATYPRIEKELNAQKELELAKMSNVEQHHGEVLKGLTEEQMCAVKIYFDALMNKKQCDDKLAQIEEAKKEYAELIADVEAQTGVKL